MPKKKRLQPPQHQRREPGREHKMKPRPKAEDEKHRGSGKLQNKVAIITGGDSGIGRSGCDRFCRRRRGRSGGLFGRKGCEGDATTRAGAWAEVLANRWRCR